MVPTHFLYSAVLKLEDEIMQQAEIGRQYAASHAGETNGEFEASLKKIQEANRQTQQLQAMISSARGVRCCARLAEHKSARTQHSALPAGYGSTGHRRRRTVGNKPR